MFIGKLRYHLPRIGFALGRKLNAGGNLFSVSGYHPNRFAYDGNNEPHLRIAFERVLRHRAGAFIDVGANCGQTLLKVLSIDPRRRYFGFEPQLDCCFYLESFKQRNRLDNVSILPVAMSSKTGATELFFDDAADETASLLATEFDSLTERRSHSTWIVARRGDEIIQELQISEIAAIKIDVEGFELEVLEGLTQTIADHHPVIFFEVLTNRRWGVLFPDESLRRHKQARADQIFDKFASIGYQIFRIDDFGDEHLIDRFDLDGQIGEHFSNDGRDYVARFRGN